MSRFPSTISLRERTAQLDGSNEDFEPVVTLTDLARPEMQFVRITALPRTSTPRVSLLPFIRGLWSLQSPWTMLAIGQPGEVRLYIGSYATGVDWPSVLESTLSGAEVVPVTDAQEIPGELSVLPSIGAITGNPYLEPDDKPPTPGPLELLTRSLHRERWAYVLLARPISEASAHRSLHAIHVERRETASNFQRRGSAEQDNHPVAQHLIGLLAAAQQQHELGAQVGMWKLAAGILTANDRDLAAAAQAVFGALARGESAPQPIRCRRIAPLSPCALTLLNSQEAVAYAALPHIELPGLRAIEQVRFSVNSPQTHSEHRVACGVVLDQRRRTPNWFEVDRDDLSRHMFVCGATGSGKTRTCQSVLMQLWMEHRIPWLVIEPAMKSEYRVLLSSECGQDLRVYTPGKGHVAPLQLNPLERPEHVGIETHVDSLVGLFSAAFGLVTPMPFVLRLALQRLYEAVEHPMLPDLQRVVRDTIAGLGYQGEIGANLRAALDLRLQTMSTGVIGQTFNVRTSTPIEDWATRPTVIELASLGDDTTRALMMGALLLRLVQERQKQGLTSALRHMAVVEEAHRLLRRQAPRGEVADASEHAAEAFAHLLAEVRAFGQALMIVDQSPARLIPDVIRNTQLKVVHRLTSSDDQSAMAASMGLDDSQRRALATLGVGEAVAFSTRSIEPCKIAIPDMRRRTATATTAVPDDHRIAEMMRSVLPLAPRTTGAQSCSRCPSAGGCQTGMAVRRHLLEHDESAAMTGAFAQGVGALRDFGTRVVRDMGLTPSPGAARCVVLQVAKAVGVSDTVLAELRQRLAN